MTIGSIIFGMGMIGKLLNKGFGWSMLFVLALIIAGAWLLMKTESRLGWVVLAVAGFVGFVALKHFNMI